MSSLLIALLGAALQAHPAAQTCHIGVKGQVSADTTPFDTTQVVVTTDDFAQLLTFLKATTEEWGKPEVVRLMKAHQIRYSMTLGNSGTGVAVPPPIQAGRLIPIPDYALIADSVPAVARGLASAKLTGRRYVQLSRTLNIAWLTDQLDRLFHNDTPQVTETTSVIGKNVAFIRAHRSDFDQLVRLGLDVISLTQQSGNPPDLNP